jgi:predicted Zn-dependent peptidase
MFNYNGPNLWMASLFHDSGVSGADIMAEVDQTLQKVADTPIEQAVLDRARVKWRSGFYDAVGGMFGFGRADLLACFALFDDDPARINTLEQRMQDVTPQLMQQTAKSFLKSSARTIYTIEPGSAN